MQPSTPTCPACGTPYTSAESVCACCGLVFGSHTPTSAPPIAFAPVPSVAVLQRNQALQSGRYTIAQPLSRGGMGALYLAHDHSAFDRPVVVKVLLDAEPGAQERFLAEARTLAQLKYATVPQIFAYFQEGPHTCIVMEHIEGRDLEQALTRPDTGNGLIVPGQPCALPDVLRWGVAVCRLLAYLASHTPPVVHQDIKPANLVLNPSGDLFLVDFGTVGGRLNAAAAYGTPGYAAPEQYRGQREPRSDVYALAATLYHLATDDDPRQHPFQFPHLAALGQFGTALDTALQHDAAQRPTAQELHAQLEQVLASQPASNAAYPPNTAIGAPDGTPLLTPAQVVRWCEGSWLDAIAWLYGMLPNHIERVWGQAPLAETLRAIMQQYTDRNIALDAALAVLDPLGYGVAQPQLSADRSFIDYRNYRSVSSHFSVGGYFPEITLTNVGRRYVRAQATGIGGWSIDQTTISLHPGAHTKVTLSHVADTTPAPNSFWSGFAPAAHSRDGGAKWVQHGRVLLEIEVLLDGGSRAARPAAPSAPALNAAAPSAPAPRPLAAAAPAPAPPSVSSAPPRNQQPLPIFSSRAIVNIVLTLLAIAAITLWLLGVSLPPLLFFGLLVLFIIATPLVLYLQGKL